ncbi:hypothetical protein B0H14DRAFT_2656865 [Mycena olivaceomarginata]|nr:hypothetical protein B0H14DRAFT_2656865 [Mycena olivaceomarginata]
MAEYIAIAQRIAVWVRPPAALPSKKEKGRGIGKKLRCTGRTVFASIGLVSSTAPWIYLSTHVAAPTPSFASSVTHTHASSSRDLTKTKPLRTRNSPSVCTRVAFAMAPALAIVRLALSVDLSGRIMSTLYGRCKHEAHNSPNARSDPRHMGTTYRGPRKGKMMKSPYPLPDAAIRSRVNCLAWAGPVQLELE